MMKKIKILAVFVLAVLFSCSKNSMDDFEIIKAKCDSSGNGSTGSSASGGCPEGTWWSPACGQANGVIWTFGTTTGSFSNQDCNGICTPMVFKFSYTMSGNTCHITYDATQPVVHCTGYADSSPNSPGPTSITITCSGNELTVTSGNGTNVFTKH